MVQIIFKESLNAEWYPQIFHQDIVNLVGGQLPPPPPHFLGKSTKSQTFLLVFTTQMLWITLKSHADLVSAPLFFFLENDAPGEVSLTLAQTSVCGPENQWWGEMHSRQYIKQLFNVSPVYLGRRWESYLKPIAAQFCYYWTSLPSSDRRFFIAQLVQFHIIDNHKAGIVSRIYNHYY